MATQVNSALVLVIAASLLTACASGYQQFYKANTSVSADRLSAIRVAPPTGKPTVERSRPDNPTLILDAYAKRGYYMIGSSMFNTSRGESDDAAIQQAIAVGADLVLILNPTYAGSITSSIPITTPTTSTAYTSATATAYGASGPVTVYGSGTTTTYGSQTTYVPLTIHRTDYGAVYFIKQKFGLGTFFRDLDDSERQRLQTNRGAVARLIADETPAFHADILVGDVFVAVDGITVTDARSISSLLAERRGKPVTFSILRGGTTLQKVVKLNP